MLDLRARKIASDTVQQSHQPELTSFRSLLTWNYYPRFTIAPTPTVRSKRSTLQEWQAGPVSVCRASVVQVQAELGSDLQAADGLLCQKRLVHDHRMNGEDQTHYLPKTETSERVHSQCSLVCTAAATCSGTMVRYSRFSTACGARALATERKARRQVVVSPDLENDM
jgi:hypothetical protein